MTAHDPSIDATPPEAGPETVASTSNGDAVTVRKVTPADPPAKPSHVFVSPRVIDDAAFESYSSALRLMLDECEQRVREVSDVVAELERRHREAAKINQRQRDHLELSGRVLSAIDQKQKHAEATLRDAEARSTGTTDAIERAIAAGVATLGRKADEHLDRMGLASRDAAELLKTTREKMTDPAELERLVSSIVDDALADAAGTLRLDVEAAARNGAEIAARAAVEALVAEHAGGLCAELNRTADEIAAHLDEGLASARDLAAADGVAIAERAAAAATEAADGSIDRLTTATGEIEQRLVREKAAMQALLSNAAATRDTLAAQLESDDIEQVARLATIAQQATAQLGSDGELAQRVAEVGRAADTLDAAIVRADAASAALSTMLDAAGDERTKASDASDRLESSANSFIAAAEGAASRFTDAKRRAVMFIDRLETSIGTADERVAPLLDLAERLDDAVTAGESVLTRFTPWMELAETDAVDTPPAALATHLDALRDETKATLTRLSDALSKAVAEAAAGNEDHRVQTPPFEGC